MRVDMETLERNARERNEVSRAMREQPDAEAVGQAVDQAYEAGRADALAETDALRAVEHSVEQLAADLDRIVEQCTAPDASDLAELLLRVRTARETLYRAEQDVETRTAKAMMGDDLAIPGKLRAERRRGRRRVEWQYDDWTRDVRDKVMRKHGLLGAHVFAADGTELDASTLHAAMLEAQSAQTKGQPRRTSLRELGLDADEYCETSTTAPTVRVYRDAGSTEGTDS